LFTSSDLTRRTASALKFQAEDNRGRRWGSVFTFDSWSDS